MREINGYFSGLMDCDAAYAAWAACKGAHLDPLRNLEEVQRRSHTIENEMTALIGRVMILERRAELNEQSLNSASAT